MNKQNWYLAWKLIWATKNILKNNRKNTKEEKIGLLIDNVLRYKYKNGHIFLLIKNINNEYPYKRDLRWEPIKKIFCKKIPSWVAINKMVFDVDNSDYFFPIKSCYFYMREDDLVKIVDYNKGV